MLLAVRKDHMPCDEAAHRTLRRVAKEGRVLQAAGERSGERRPMRVLLTPGLQAREEIKVGRTGSLL